MFKNVLESVVGFYDYIIIDFLLVLGLFMINLFLAVYLVIIFI